MNIRKKIQTLEKLKSEVEDIEEELGKYITSRLMYLYKLQEEYRKTNPGFIPLVGWEDISVGAGDIEILRDNNLTLHYYNTYTYNSDDIVIPIDALEDDVSVSRWFEIKIREFEDVQEKEKKKREDKEYSEYLKLKEKYENKNTI